MIGKKRKTLPPPALQIKDNHSPHPLFLYLYGSKIKGNQSCLRVVKKNIEEGEAPADIAGLEEPPVYCMDLHSQKISENFLRQCAEVISICSCDIKLLNNAPVKALMMMHGKSILRIFIRNDAYSYVHPEIDLNRKICSIKTIAFFPYKPVPFQGSKFTVRVPGKGVVVLDVILK